MKETWRSTTVCNDAWDLKRDLGWWIEGRRISMVTYESTPWVSFNQDRELLLKVHARHVHTANQYFNEFGQPHRDVALVAVADDEQRHGVAARRAAQRREPQPSVVDAGAGVAPPQRRVRLRSIELAIINIDTRESSGGAYQHLGVGERVVVRHVANVALERKLHAER